jgi:hypothetical protein
MLTAQSCWVEAYQAAKTQMTVVTTIATNDNDVGEDGCMRLP